MALFRHSSSLLMRFMPIVRPSESSASPLLLVTWSQGLFAAIFTRNGLICLRPLPSITAGSLREGGGKRQTLAFCLKRNQWNKLILRRLRWHCNPSFRGAFTHRIRESGLREKAPRDRARTTHSGTTHTHTHTDFQGKIHTRLDTQQRQLPHSCNPIVLCVNTEGWKTDYKYSYCMIQDIILYPVSLVSTGLCPHKGRTLGFAVYLFTLKKKAGMTEKIYRKVH